MLKRLLAFLLFCLFIPDLYSNADTTQIKNSQLKAVELQHKNPRESIRLAESALELAKQARDSVSIADVYKLLGTIYFQLNKIESATYNYMQSLVVSRRIEYKLGQSTALYNLGLVYSRQQKYDQALTFISNAISIDSAANNNNGLADCYNAMGIIHENKENLNGSLSFYRKSNLIFSENQDTIGIAVSLHNIGTIYRKMGNLTKALDFYNKSLVYSETKSNQTRYLLTKHAIGEVYEIIGKYDVALSFYFEVINENECPANIKAMSFNNIGNVYRLQKNYAKAIENYEQSLVLMKECNNLRGTYIAYDNIGTIYELRHENEQALDYFTKALQLKKQGGDYREIAASKNNIGYVFLNENKFKDAIKNFKKAYAIRKQFNDLAGAAMAAQNIALSLHNQQKNKEAINYLNESLIYAKQLKSDKILKNAYQLLAKAQAQVGLYEEAYENQLRYESLKDSVFNAQSDKRLKEMQTKYETVEKIKENNRLRDDNLRKQETIKLQKYIVISVLVAITFLVFGIVNVFRSRRKEKRANTKLVKQNDKIKNQAYLLQKQNSKLRKLDKFKQDLTAMIAHDLKNPLNNLLNNSKEQQTISAGNQMLTMILNMLDVYKFEDTKIDLQTVNYPIEETITKACNQTKYLADKKNIDLVFQPEFSAIINQDREILVRVFVNLLTNAIKYSPINEPIEIRFSRTDNQPSDENVLAVRITNYGPKIPEEYLDKIFDKFNQISPKKSGMVKSTGLGLTFCKMAIESHKGKIFVEPNQEYGTTFRIELPVRSIKDKSLASKSTKETKKVRLSDDDKKLLIEILPKLKEYELFEISKIKTLLSKVENSSNALKLWGNDYISASIHGNQRQIDNLLAEVQI